MEALRFSVAMPEELLMRFDQLVARRGLAKNRSEVVRDLVRDALVEDECATPGVEGLAVCEMRPESPNEEYAPKPAGGIEDIYRHRTAL